MALADALTEGEQEPEVEEQGKHGHFGPQPIHGGVTSVSTKRFMDWVRRGAVWRNTAHYPAVFFHTIWYTPAPTAIVAREAAEGQNANTNP